MLGDCANCNCGHICATKGVSCTPVDKEAVLSQYSPEERKMMEAAAYVEATYYMQYTRIQETAAFAQRMGYKKSAWPFASALATKWSSLPAISRNFSTSILFAAKLRYCQGRAGPVPGHAGKPHRKHVQPENQAHFLNEQGCELFVSAGLCVGHDAIFNASCKGPVTNLIAKDRVLAHNPMGAVYSNYWRNKLGLNGED